MPALCRRPDSLGDRRRTDTRFGRAEDFLAAVEAAAGRPAIRTVQEAEPIGPKALLDVLVIAPCTGNTLGKLAGGVTDTSVTMAAKAHLRNGRPVVVALASNDGLSGSAANLGTLLNRRGYYFVPFGQDDPARKPCSLMADFTRIGETVEAALAGPPDPAGAAGAGVAPAPRGKEETRKSTGRAVHTRPVLFYLGYRRRRRLHHGLHASTGWPFSVRKAIKVSGSSAMVSSPTRSQKLSMP